MEGTGEMAGVVLLGRPGNRRNSFTKSAIVPKIGSSDRSETLFDSIISVSIQR